jgi:ketosteroid isomerase-like protein
VRSPKGEAVVKKSNIAMLPIAVLAALIFGWCPTARADDQQTISKLERKIATITNGDEAMKYWERGDDIELFDVMGPPREFVGYKAIHDHADQFSGWTDIKVDFLELKVISDGKLALAHSVQHAAMKVNRKPFEMTYRVTDVWRKRDDQWKLVNSHVSLPVDMKTGKADMGSKM